MPGSTQQREADRRWARDTFEMWSRDLFRCTNSTNRLPAFLNDCRDKAALLADKSELFWAFFYEVWNSCDTTWPYRHDVLALLRQHRDYCHAFEKYYGVADCLEDPAEVAFNESLPDKIRVFRGCSRDRIRGLAWTTDYNVARDFARGHRRISVPNPVVAECVVPQHIVLATFAGRKESELVLDFKRLPKKITLHPFVDQATPD